MSDGMRSPRILAVSRGRMEVEGIGAGKDFKLYPGGGRERDWNETGTRHSPGIQPADAEELLAHGATAVVLSPGVNRRLQGICRIRSWGSPSSFSAADFSAVPPRVRSPRAVRTVQLPLSPRRHIQAAWPR